MRQLAEIGYPVKLALAVGDDIVSDLFVAFQNCNEHLIGSCIDIDATDNRLLLADRYPVGDLVKRLQIQDSGVIRRIAALLLGPGRGVLAYQVAYALVIFVAASFNYPLGMGFAYTKTSGHRPGAAFADIHPGPSVNVDLLTITVTRKIIDPADVIDRHILIFKQPIQQTGRYALDPKQLAYRLDLAVPDLIAVRHVNIISALGPAGTDIVVAVAPVYDAVGDLLGHIRNVQKLVFGRRVDIQLTRLVDNLDRKTAQIERNVVKVDVIGIPQIVITVADRLCFVVAEDRHGCLDTRPARPLKTHLLGAGHTYARIETARLGNHRDHHRQKDDYPHHGNQHQAGRLNSI